MDGPNVNCAGAFRCVIESDDPPMIERPTVSFALRGDLGIQAACEASIPSFGEARQYCSVGSRRRTMM